MSNTASIELLVADGIVDEVVQRVKTGKEAEVFVVRKGDNYLAAKVYKERTQRNFKNNVGYMEGRSVRNSRDMRAMGKRTKYGVAKAEDEWMHTEHDALMTLLDAGVRVPKAELFYEGVLLMELVLGQDGQPAPRLNDLSMSPEEAVAHHRDVVGMIVRMLCCDLIHGDLSPFNILMAWNGPTIIDLPQVVKAAHNSQAEQYLVRDVRNVTDYFARHAPELKKRLNDGHQIWRKYMRRELNPEFFPEEGQSFVPDREFVPNRGAPRGQRPEGRPPGTREQRPFGPPRGGQPGRGPRPPQGAGQQRPRPEGSPGEGPRPPQQRPSEPRRMDAPRPQRTEQRFEQRSEQRPEQRSEQRPEQRPEQRSEQRPEQRRMDGPRPQRSEQRPQAPKREVAVERRAPLGAASSPGSAPGAPPGPAGRFSHHHRRR